MTETQSEVVLTIDVEWAHPLVLADVVDLIEERGLRATFFCTHEGIELPGHERALHPNYRRAGNSLTSPVPQAALGDGDGAFYRFILSKTQAFCPEAVGVRAHSLFFDSKLLPLYEEAGLQYQSDVFLPLAAGLEPVWRGGGMLELPLYYMDYWDLWARATSLELEALRLDTPGLKVIGFHPNLVYLNASTVDQYIDSKSYYHDPDRLRKMRRPGRGIRTLFLEVLDRLADRPAVPVLAEVNAQWRAGR
jgi:hypothetical protein